MSTLTPNMSLVVPTIGIDSGLFWEQSINANSSILDGHNHAPGSGTLITNSGINVISDFAINGNNIITIRSCRFMAQISPLATPSDIGCIYVSGFDLYYNDVNGNKIQITSGGSVNATSSGISSGTATASFSSSVLVVNAASNTPANIQGGSVLIGNPGVSGSKYVTLSITSALAANYNIVLPSLPAQTNVVTLDTSGNLASITYDAVGQAMTLVGANAIAATMSATGADAIAVTMGATGANTIAANRTRTVGTPSAGIGGFAISGSSGAFTTSSGTPVQVTNLQVTLTTSGRPVMFMLKPDGIGGNASIGNGSVQGTITVQRGAGVIALFQVPAVSQGVPPGAIIFVDTFVNGSAGTYSYTFNLSVNGTGFTAVTNCVLVAYEL